MLSRTRKLWWNRFGASALGAMLFLPVAGEVNGQGPVRNTARGVAQGAANITRGAAQATGNVARGVAQGTANTLQRTGQATRNIVRGATPPYSGRITSNYRGGVQANGAVVQGQTYGQTQYNQYGQPIANGQAVAQGQTWYDSQVQPATAYGTTQSGMAQGYAASNQVYRLRHDAQGREFICQNGQRVYFTNTVSNQNSQTMNEDGQQMDSQNDQNWSNQNQNESDVQSSDQTNSQDSDRAADQNQDVPEAPQPSADADADVEVDTDADLDS